MAHRTAEPSTKAGFAEPPPDIVTMRDTVNRLLDPDSAPEALPPTSGEVDTLTRAMRGQLELMIPEIEGAVRGRPQNVAQYCALACVGEARGKLRVQAQPGYESAVAYARRLARALCALCDHYERLIGVAS
ncbi:DUF6415 family natural product biosynthesis protein [Streptomyces sp. NPDC005485]|uniref:DUF6415 family natural product biosynthesis protein n=1 Tax=Streptomyces sp. NPDC005485 TaxID=3155591 RepID=UPI0033A13E41